MKNEIICPALDFTCPYISEDDFTCPYISEDDICQLEDAKTQCDCWSDEDDEEEDED